MKDFIPFYYAEDIASTIAFSFNPKTKEIREDKQFEDRDTGHTTHTYPLDIDELNTEVLEALRNEFTAEEIGETE